MSVSTIKIETVDGGFIEFDDWQDVHNFLKAELETQIKFERTVRKFHDLVLKLKESKNERNC